MNFNFGEVLTRAWQIVWKYKVLWIFGVLAGCGRGGGGGNGGGGNSGFQTQGPNIKIPPQIMHWFQVIQENLTTTITIGIALLCLIWIIAIFLATIGRIGLIRGTSQAEEGVEKLIFGQLFSESTPYFWRMLGLSLIIALPILFLFAMLFAGLIVFVVSASEGNQSAGLGIAAMVPLMIGCICLLVPVMFVVGMIIRQSERAIVLEDLSLLPALSRGWEVFRNNLGPIILMAIILAVIGFVMGLIVAIPILLIVVPTAFTFAFSQGQNWNPMIFAAVCICLYIPVAWLINGIVTAYIESAWTLTYMRLTAKPKSDEEVKPNDSDKTMIAGVNA